MSNLPKTYTEEFKREALRLAKERGNIAATAPDLGVSDTSILYWSKQADVASSESHSSLLFPMSSVMRTRLRRGSDRGSAHETGNILR
jgi:transposase-like protein